MGSENVAINVILESTSVIDRYVYVNLTKGMLNSRCILDDKFGKLADSEFVLIIHG
jgi:hypothetical protein